MSNETKSLSMYEMTTEMLAILEAEEVDEVMMEAAFGALVNKDNRICHFIRDVESFTLTCKFEENRISAKRKALENKIDRLKALIQTSMERLEMDTLETGTFKLSIQDNPVALDPVDPSLCPKKFRILIPATWQPDNAKIKTALKAGETVKGFGLKRGRSLRIK